MDIFPRDRLRVFRGFLVITVLVGDDTCVFPFRTVRGQVLTCLFVLFRFREITLLFLLGVVGELSGSFSATVF